MKRFLLTLLVAACATEPTTPIDPIDPVTPPELEPPAPPPVATTSVCTTGKIRCLAQVRVSDKEQIRAAVVPEGYGPRDLIAAYNVNTKFAPSSTIAIVDAYDYPNAEADLATYRAQFHLPPCTVASGCFARVNDQGAAAPLPAQTPPPGDDWNLEAALDLDMASAMCPSCKIVLVEGEDDISDSLFQAQNGAASLSPAVISNSWGAIEDGVFEDELEPLFDHPGIGIFAATGDFGFDFFGFGPMYPSTSAHVTAVGGTSLIPSTNGRGFFERAWNGAGSSCSLTIPRPAFQAGIDTSCDTRAASDVSAVADPATGVAVFNANDGGWVVVGGTSVASPLVASLYARYGLGSRALGYSYREARRFFDVHSGNNGDCSIDGSGRASDAPLCKSVVGWDGPTGIGSPNAQLLQHF